MHILVTNDDGVTAPGLAALAQAMRQCGKVSVVAPDRDWSGRDWGWQTNSAVSGEEPLLKFTEQIEKTEEILTPA